MGGALRLGCRGGAGPTLRTHAQTSLGMAPGKRGHGPRREAGWQPALPGRAGHAIGNEGESGGLHGFSEMRPTGLLDLRGWAAGGKCETRTRGKSERRPPFWRVSPLVAKSADLALLRKDLPPRPDLAKSNIIIAPNTQKSRTIYKNSCEFGFHWSRRRPGGSPEGVSPSGVRDARPTAGKMPALPASPGHLTCAAPSGKL